MLKYEYDRVNQLLAQQVELNKQLYSEFRLFTNAVIKLQKQKDEQLHELRLKVRQDGVLEQMVEHFKSKCISLE